jgi:hypothetical protein
MECKQTIIVTLMGPALDFGGHISIFYLNGACLQEEFYHIYRFTQNFSISTTLVHIHALNLSICLLDSISSERLVALNPNSRQVSKCCLSCIDF